MPAGPKLSHGILDLPFGSPYSLSDQADQDAKHMTESSSPFRRPAGFATVLALFFATAGMAQIPRQEKAQLDLAADRTAYEAGTTAHVIARVTIEPGWHVNSHKPTFDYLIPTTLDLELPSGWPE